MASFGRPRDGNFKKNSRGNSPRNNDRGDRDDRPWRRSNTESRPRSRFDGQSSSRGGFGDRNRGSRDSGGFGRGNKELQMTKVICASCKNECEVPFRPNSSKPVYCRDCFSKQDNMGQGRNTNSSRDLEMINEKLDKIIKALNIH